MIRFDRTPADDPQNKWRYQLDEFVEDNKQQLAALAWGLLQEWEDDRSGDRFERVRDKTLGIDLKPQPHFVACSREAIEQLNRKVNNQLREILGILDGYKPEKEVVIIAIGEGQIKLINFQPDPSPPECFERLEEDLDTSIESLEKRLNQYMWD